MQPQTLANSDKQLFNKMLLWQSIATVTVSLIAFFYAGQHAMFSMLIGGLSVVIASFFAARIANKSRYAKVAAAALVNILIAEVVKIFLIVVLLTIAYAQYQQLIPVALLMGLMVAAIVAVSTIRLYKR